MQKRVVVVGILALLLIIPAVSSFADPAGPEKPVGPTVEAAPVAATPPAASSSNATSGTVVADTSEEFVPQEVLELARLVKGTVKRHQGNRVTNICPVNSTCGTPNHCAETGSCTSHVDTGDTCCDYNGIRLCCESGGTIHTWNCNCTTTCNPPCLCANYASHWACEGGIGEQ